VQSYEISSLPCDFLFSNTRASLPDIVVSCQYARCAQLTILHRTGHAGRIGSFYDFEQPIKVMLGIFLPEKSVNHMFVSIITVFF
jgi:hypothetical protein